MVECKVVAQRIIDKMINTSLICTTGQGTENTLRTIFDPIGYSNHMCNQESSLVPIVCVASALWIYYDEPLNGFNF